MKLPFDLKNIKPGEFAYLTKRKLENKQKEAEGEIIVWRKQGNEESEFVVKCPFCLEESSGKTVFTKRPYRIRCPVCNRSISLSKLTKSAKKR